jgi:hypothetical protein
VVEEVPSETRPRDATGKFLAKTENPSPVATTHDVPPAPEAPVLQRPTTWKKEYLPLWDKLQSGQQLTPEEAVKFLQYANQRENEYKTGVSTYKGEAENAKANGIHPAAWINNLGRAHQVLAKGNDQQRLDMFVKLANDYRVPLQNLLGGQEPTQQNQQLSQTQAQIDNLTKWIENEKQTRLTTEINRIQSDTEHFPHFDQVRETMAQLLESGMAPNLEAAYTKAVRMQDDVWQIEQERLLNAARTETSKATAVAKAKAAAVSPKSATPSSTATAKTTKDRRSLLESAFDENAGGRV